MEAGHFWFRGRWALVERWLSQHRPADPCKLLDLGCGTGHNLVELSRRGYEVVGIDLSLFGLQMAAARLPKFAVVQGNVEELPFADRTFHALIALDILEHVDDAKAVSEAYRVLKPAGLALFTVPAWPSLYSYRDRAAGHLRRYRPNQLRQLLKGTGFEVLQVQYYMSLLFPFLALGRMLARSSRRWRDIEDTPHPIINGLLSKVVSVEVRTKRWLNIPWGSSLVALARRLP